MVWKLRFPNNNEAESNQHVLNYGSDSELFSIKIHHSGKFVMNENKLVYVEGKIAYVDDCSVDEMSILELAYMTTELNMIGNLEFYCSKNGIDDCSSLVHLTSDNDTLSMYQFVGDERMLGLFVCHEKLALSATVLPEVDEPLPCIGFCEVLSSDSDGEVSIGHDSNHSDFYDSEACYYDEDYKVDTDAEVNNLQVQLKEKGIKPWELGENEKFPDYSRHGSRLHEGFKVFNPETDMNEVKLEKEMCFTSAEVFRAAIRKHAVDNGRTIKCPTNNKNKVQVKCAADNCPFYVHASKSEKDNTFQIKVIHFEHDCTRLINTLQVDTRFLVKKYGAKIRRNPKWEVKAMLAEVNNECQVSFSKKQIYRAKRKIAQMDCGDGSEQFSLIRQYGKEIIRSNPSSTVKIKTRKLGDERYFKRIYICWGALKDGMLGGCRKVILLDGCHIRTRFGGVILTAIGIDSNNATYPFAYAVVEKETEKSWLWFLDLVKSDLNITNCEEWMLMSDKQKGLVKAVATKFDGCEHRFCVVHLYSNFKLLHKGLTLKGLLWNAARATRVVDFERVMEELKATDMKAYEWLCKRPPQNWSKAFFKTITKCDLLLNNLSESFNCAIAKIRMLPILWMLEGIRCKLMDTIGEKKQKMERFRGVICPRITAMYEKNLKLSTEFFAHWNGNEEFNVQRHEFGTSYRVLVSDKFCSCRRWQLTGIPCAHAILALQRLGHRPQEWIDKCYSNETYLRIYSHYLVPIASKEEWPLDDENAITILPPIVESQPGRPKEFKRILQPGEKKGKIIQTPSQSQTVQDDMQFGKVSRQGKKLQCGLCRSFGHNARKCSLNPLTTQPAEKRKEIPGTSRKKKQAGDDDNGVQTVSTTSSRPTKMQVRRNVQSWLNCSTGGVSLTQPTSSMSQPNHVVSMSQPNVVTSGLTLTQTFGGKHSRYSGDAIFSSKPAGGKKK